MILDNKGILTPPPPYTPAGGPPPFSQLHERVTLSNLPPYALLQIVHEIFPPGQPEGQRRILYWLAVSLRRVCRSLYVGMCPHTPFKSHVSLLEACMHVLRSTYLPIYASLVRAPYSSDPFPMSSPEGISSGSPASPVHSLQRETRVLDLFIALKVREDVRADESELHLEREDSFKDLFDLMQPRARLEDVVRLYGTRAAIIHVTGSSEVPSAPPSRCQTPNGTRSIPFNLLYASFAPRRVGLTLATKQRRRTIVEVARTRDQTLEASAVLLVRELAAWVAANPHISL